MLSQRNGLYKNANNFTHEDTDRINKKFFEEAEDFNI